MKIAMVSPSQIPARRANTIQVMKMAQALVELGYEVRLAVPQTDPASPPATWDSLAEHYGLRKFFPVDWLPASPVWRRYDYGYRSVRWAQRWGADLLYTRLPQAAALASQMRMATILECHDMPQGISGPWLFRLFLQGAGAIRLIVITQALLDDLAMKYRNYLSGKIPSVRLPGNAFTVIAPDGVDLERYPILLAPIFARLALVDKGVIQPPEHSLSGSDEKSFFTRFTVGYTGHLYAGRGIELILAMAKALPEINFLLVGGEPANVSRLREQIHQQGLMNVICIGFVSNAELPFYQAACDIFLLPYQKQVSASSGGDIARYLSPMKLFEYMACGRAILCSDLPVLREVLNPQNAMLLPSDEASAWVNAIQALQVQPELGASLAKQALSDVVKYTWRARARRVMQGIKE